MFEYEISLPTDKQVTVDVTDISLYNYDFKSFGFVPLQKAASLSLAKTIIDNVIPQTSKIELIEKVFENKAPSYFAKFSEIAEQKMQSGEWALGIRKSSGENYGVIKNTLTGKIESSVTLEKSIVRDLGSSIALAAIQSQLASISEGIEDLSNAVHRVEQGQYNDRYAGFYMARQLIIESLSANDISVKNALLLEAIKSNNDTISKLMLSIHQDAMLLSDEKTKRKEVVRATNFIQTSLLYLNASVQLNLVAYTSLGENQSLFAALANYRAFISQELLHELKNGKTVAWRIDNGIPGSDGKILELSTSVTQKIDKLMVEYEQRKIEEN